MFDYIVATGLILGHIRGCRHEIAEILLKVTLSTKVNEIIRG
jgi:hypothetical protein